MGRSLCRLALLSGMIVMTACSQVPTNQSSRMETPEADDGPIRYLALGDSYTIGESVASNRRWPVLLVRSLRKEGLEVARPRIVAKTGWTTEELSEAMDERNSEPPYDLVTLLIGVNDQYRGMDAEGYAKRFEQLLQRAINLAGGRKGRVIVVSIPDWGVTPFARKDERSRAQISREIERFNEVKRRIAEDHDVTFVNVTDLSKRVAEDITLVANDGLHPSGRQYELWLERILPAARRALRVEK